MVALASVLTDLPVRLGHIAYFIMLPMLVVVGIGYLLQRKLGMDPKTLTRLNFYFVVPGVVYYSVVTSVLTAADAGKVILFTVLVQFVLAVVTVLAARLRGVPREQVNAMIATTVFYNSGNYGLPLQELALRPYVPTHGKAITDTGISLQVVVMLVQNVTNFTLGILLAAGAKKDRHWRENLLHIVKFPPLYALTAALITVQVRRYLMANHGPDTVNQWGAALMPFWDVARFLREAFIATALVTMGCQLALVKHHLTAYPVKLSVALRLLGGPAVGLLLIWLMGIQGLLAQVLLISTGTPTAINAMLICMEMDNHPDFLARAVFYSTLLSPVTLALVILLSQSGAVPWLVIQ